MPQKLITPDISDCYCGEKAKLIDWDFRDMWRVICDKNHTLTRECGTKHRAICLWNNRIAARGEMMKNDKYYFEIGHTLAKIYASEINFSITTFWDGGFTVKLGDDMNGFLSEDTFDDMGEAVDFLKSEVIKHFPNSAFTKTCILI